MNKKIVCLGAGSIYFRRGIPDLLLSKDLSGSELVLYDIDAVKTQKMAVRSKELAIAAETNITVRWTTDIVDAIDGADYAIASIGGSGADISPQVYQSRYHNADILIPTKYGIHQIIGDTCGPAGMMMGLRTVPVYLDICHAMEKYCPNVIFFNHSNPMAVLCRAMHKYSTIKTIGICHGVQEGITHTSKVLSINPEELDCTWIGTNHYYWFTRIAHKGRDMYPELMKWVADSKDTDGASLCKRLAQCYGYQIVYPSDDHIVEFYPFLTQLNGHAQLPDALLKSAKEHGYGESMHMPDEKKPSAEERAAFFREYDKLVAEMQLPEYQDNSITGEGLGKLISAIATGRREICIVNVANNGVIPNLSHEGEVEVEAVTDSSGVRSVMMGNAPLVLKGMLEKRFAWHELVADAAVKGERRLALQSLLLDEMAIMPEKAEIMLNELLYASRELLPRFF